jgi:hypothetical protein
MNGALTDAQMRGKYVQAMGPELGTVFHELEYELWWMWRKWVEFHELFDKGPEQIELLNLAASSFFYVVQRLLFEDAMMHLSRLTDPPKSAGNETLTLTRLECLIRDPTLKAQIKTKTEKVKTECEFARQWRNKRLAHTDLVAFRAGISSLPAVNVKNVDDAIASSLDLLKSIEEHYGFPPSTSVVDPWGASALVRIVKQARQRPIPPPPTP